MDSESEMEKRERKLTDKGLVLYIENVEKHQKKIRSTVSDIEDVIHQMYENIDSDISNLQQLRETLTDKMNYFDKASTEYLEFLRSTRSSESAIDEAAHNLLVKSLTMKIIDAQAMLKQKLRPTEVKHKSEQATETKARSVKSKSSKHSSSTTSSASSEIIKQKAKLAAARVRKQYAQKERDIIMRKAELESSIKVLNSERDIVEAEVQIKTMEDIIENDNLSERSSVCEETVIKRTEEFVRNSSSNWLTGQAEHQPLPVPSKPDIPLNPKAPEFTPNLTGQSKDNNDNTLFSEFSKYMFKKDLLVERLTSYDDQPDMYLAWKRSFKSVINEFGITPVEEVDLLVKFLGPTSKKQALRIRAASTDKWDHGLSTIWERLEDRYGSPELVESTIKRKIDSFPKLSPKDNKQLYELSDIVTEIESIMLNERYRDVFSYYNSSSGVKPIIEKLPFNIQEKWTTEASKYKTQNNAIYPPFGAFVEFINRVAKVRNDPSFQYDSQVNRNTQVKRDVPSRSHVQGRPNVSSHKTELNETPSEPPVTSKTNQNCDSCPVHEGANHVLNRCRAFRRKPLSERMDFLKDNGYCFKCCGPKKHLSRKCTETVKCWICKSDKHPTALHVYEESSDRISSDTVKSHGGERVSASCTQICGDLEGTSKSCAKIILVNVYPEGCPDLSRTIYCLIDDQSNGTLAKTKFFDEFNENGMNSEYILKTCSGQFTSSGRLAHNYVIESLDQNTRLKLPQIIECNDIPNNRNEIPCPDIARKFEHLRDIASFIPPLQANADIELLIGRDLTKAHYVLDQRIAEDGLPYAQQLPLGWVMIGETCLGKVHRPDVISVNKTHILENGRTSLFEPCFNNFKVKTDPLFIRTKDDEKVGLSVEDRNFLELMDENCERDSLGHWTAPLPFRKDRNALQNNREAALKRARSFDFSLKKNKTKHDHVIDFMNKMLQNGHAEVAPPIDAKSEVWYLPIFGVYHPQKPDKIRIVFDSSAQHNGVSLNDVLMKGPDLTNSLLGILLRFRREAIAITADVEQMFYNFKVNQEHRDYLRFIWHADNDISKPLIDYRMTVHVFGNSPSPSVATYGLRKSVEQADIDVKDFVSNNFYVDDGLVSCEDVDKAVSLMKRTQAALADGGNLRLHKISSSSKEVLNRFPVDDLAKSLKDITFNDIDMPMQRSLGMAWDINSDTFTYQVASQPKAFTRRGVLSTINGLFDPIGFTAPVSVRGKLLLREMMTSHGQIEWDDPLPEQFMKVWESWVESLQLLNGLHVPRMYCPSSFAQAKQREVHIFSDASKEAIGAVAYLKLIKDDSCETSFIMGKAKVAPLSGHTIPRLELCGAVLAVEIGDIIRENLNIDPSNFYFYTDSQVVLGYISNETRRFYVYVSNRVSRIRASSNPSQWRYVATDRNPADIATRGIESNMLQDSAWLKGPSFISSDTPKLDQQECYDLIDAGNDKEIRPEVTILNTTVQKPSDKLGTDRFTRFSEWNRLVSAIAFLQRKVRSEFKSESVTDRIKAEQLIIKAVQMDTYETEICFLREGKQLPRNSSLLPLKPILDQNGILRVSGRLTNSATISDPQKQPIIIPKESHVAILLIRHFHNRVCHQGRQITEGSIRSGGYWIIGGRRLISTLIHKCVICRKLRGQFCCQQMADLPKERITASPAFTFVGVDTFGPWPIVYRRTRGGQANQKRWALLFTCLVTRAIHIELIEELSSSCFINALRRFIAIRGPVQQFRSDRGTNFVGATEDLNINAQFIENDTVQNFLSDRKISWIFNPPHASHMGGAWERLIGVSRRILDSMLLKNRFKDLTHDILATFMAEVTAIVNSRPLTTVSTDPDYPEVLSPALLLTQKYAVDIHPFPNFGKKDLLRHQWKFVQSLADEFWQRWQNEYLNQLQTRQKWQSETPNVKVGNIVLMKDKDCARVYWPVGIIERVFPSSDGKVRTVEICVMKDDKRVRYVRPITQIISLFECDD